MEETERMGTPLQRKSPSHMPTISGIITGLSKGRHGKVVASRRQEENNSTQNIGWLVSGGGSFTHADTMPVNHHERRLMQPTYATLLKQESAVNVQGKTVFSTVQSLTALEEPINFLTGIKTSSALRFGQ